MKSAARSPVLVPALVLCAALTAADGAWAAEEPVVPFPGAAVEDETPKGNAGPALPETATGPASIGTPAGKGAVEHPRHETQAETPSGGSRLLRVLAETRKPPAPPDGGAAASLPVFGTSVFGTSVFGTSVSGTSVFAAEGCPRALLRRLLAGAAGEADALSALGIEREILTLCRERQEILVGLFEAEAALRELSAPPPATEPVARRSEAVAPAPAPRTQIAPPTRQAAPSPLRAALAAVEETSDEAAPRGGEPRAPRYAWFSIVGSAGALRAGVTDGSGVWFVREGDALPGGARIAAIDGRPPAVRVTVSGETPVPETLVPGNGEATPLPYRPRPGDVQ